MEVRKYSDIRTTTADFILDEIDEDDENVHAFQIDDTKIDVSASL